MSTISLCMIVKNEEKNLAACLSSVAGAVDEIIIADTGSTDGTVEVARRFTEKVYYFEWVNDFSAARNFSLSKATMDYTMWLDADDILLPQNREKLITLKNRLGENSVDIVSMDYHFNHDKHGNVIHMTRRERIIKRSLGLKFVGTVHEAVPYRLNGGLKIIDSDIFVTHTKNFDLQSADSPSFIRNLDLLRLAITGGNYSFRDVYYYGTSLYSIESYDEALVWLHRFFDDPGDMLYNSTIAYVFAHEIYLKKGDLSAALAVLLDYEERNSHAAEYYTTLGRFWQKHAFDFQKAAEAYTKALKCTGTTFFGGKANRYKDYYYYFPYVGLGETCIEMKDYKNALIYYQKALNEKPEEKEIPNIIRKLKRIVELTESSE